MHIVNLLSMTRNKDICRENTDVSDRNANALRLRNGLVAFVLLQPKVGYVQGMNDLFARISRVFDDDQARSC